MPKTKPPNSKSEDVSLGFPDDTSEFKSKLKKCDPEIRKCINDWRIYLREIYRIKEVFHSNNVKLKAKIDSLQLDNKSLENELNECRALYEKLEKDFIAHVEHEVSKK